MIDFTQEASWFIAGLTATIVMTLLLLVFLAAARRSERHD
jgi:hypothetical protein